MQFQRKTCIHKKEKKQIQKGIIINKDQSYDWSLFYEMGGSKKLVSERRT